MGYRLMLAGGCSVSVRGVLAGAALALGVFGAAGAAQASTVLISNVSVYNWNQVDLPGGTYGNYVSTGITFTETPSGDSFLAFCVDLQHNVGVGAQSPALVYQEGFLTHDGAGNVLSVSRSNRIGRLADLGRYYVATGASDLGNKLSAIQAAIWTIEYGLEGMGPFNGFSGGLSYLNARVDQHLTITDNGRGRARALIAHAPGDPRGTQNMTIGGVPEPATWVMMIGGFAVAGGALRRRRAVAA